MMKNNKCIVRISILRLLCAAIFVLASANSTLAQDWRLEPVLKVGGELDDNAALDPRTDQEVELTGLLFEARADIFFNSPKTSFFVQPRVLVRNYNDDAILDSDDYFLRSNFRHRGGSSTIGYRLNYDHQAVRTAERLDTDLEIEDPDEITNDDSGRVFVFGTRQRLRVSPYWEYRLSSVSSVIADFHYTEATYKDIPTALLADFSDMRVNLKYRRAISNVTSWGITVSGRTYDSDSLSDEVDTTAVLVSVRRDLSEKTNIEAKIGIEDVDEAGFDIDPEVVGGLRYIRNLEIIRLLAEYRRSVYGSGAGVISVRDSINLNFQRRLNERISAGLGVRAYETNRLGGSVSAEQRRYVQLQSNLFWYLSRSFVIELDYRYTAIDRGDSLGGVANSNQLMMWLIYQPRTVPKI